MRKSLKRDAFQVLPGRARLRRHPSVVQVERDRHDDGGLMETRKAKRRPQRVGLVHGPWHSQVQTGKFLAWGTDCPACLQPDVDQDGSELKGGTLARPDGKPCPKVGLAAGTVERAGEVVDASELLADMDCGVDHGLGR